MNDSIRITGARTHNLKNISVEIPRNKLVVITGLSGSGKSSLAFDTIYAEGQRRYWESVSSYARAIGGALPKPDVDQIEGISPAIAIEQRTLLHNPRSTVGTISEIYDYLRLWFARAGTLYCPACNLPVSRQNTSTVVDYILKLAPHTKLLVTAPLPDTKNPAERAALLRRLARAGYQRLWEDKLLVIDEYSVVASKRPLEKHPDRARLVDSVETAFDLGNGVLVIISPRSGEIPRAEGHGGEGLVFSTSLRCSKCSRTFPSLSPKTFSFNTAEGACPACNGLGVKAELDPDLLIPNKKLSLLAGAIRPWSRANREQEKQVEILRQLEAKAGIKVNAPVCELSPNDLKIVLHGLSGVFAGVIPELLEKYRTTDSTYVRSEIEGYMREQICPACGGTRLRAEARLVRLGDLVITDTLSTPLSRLIKLIEGAADQINPKLRAASEQIIGEIKHRLELINRVGLGYLTLARPALTLSGGELQRLRLSTQLGARLSGLIYVLDEPSVGLHQSDHAQLLKLLKELRDLGNTVIVVEHDRETMEQADYLIDVGPGAGTEGGEIVAAGTPREVRHSDQSLTGRYLTGEEKIDLPKRRRKGIGKVLEVLGASEFNLKNIDVRFPLGTLTAVTGVSGSGKSTLVHDILSRALSRKLSGSTALPGAHRAIRGIEHINKVIAVDQSPIGRTPRSNAATYTGLFAGIREVFAATEEARLRGYDAGRFSFNVRGGRCEQCRGEGYQTFDAFFLPDVYVECDRCHGTRYAPDVLEIHYKQKNIAEILKLTVDEALSFFGNVPAVRHKLATLAEVGLGYLTLGQPATALSGGEAQRIKLATELSRVDTGKTLYILDEPTTGLHFDDIKKLLQILHHLVEKKNTVIVIEHNLDVIKCADWVVDLGPGGGDEGGHLVSEGTPETIAKDGKSLTGRYLRKYL